MNSVLKTHFGGLYKLFQLKVDGTILVLNLRKMFSLNKLDMLSVPNIPSFQQRSYELLDIYPKMIYLFDFIVVIFMGFNLWIFNSLDPTKHLNILREIISVAILAEISYFARNLNQNSDRNLRSIGRDTLPKNARYFMSNAI